MFPTFLLMAATALAEPIHTGVPILGIEGLGIPRFQTVDTGWMANVQSGFVGVYVGRTEADTSRWVQAKLKSLAAHKPQPNTTYATNPGVDEAFGDGEGLLIFRSANIGVISRNTADATAWADTIRNSIVSIGAPWPNPPELIIADGYWTIEHPKGTSHVAFVGGQPDTSPALRFVKPPYRLISWDGWGRASWTEVAVPE